jgi:hypothetical protein
MSPTYATTLENILTKSKGIGRGGSRQGAGRPSTGGVGKTSYFATRITQKTRKLLEQEAAHQGRSKATIAEKALQIGLDELAARRRPEPLRALFFCLEWLAHAIPAYRRHDYSVLSNPYMFAAFRAAVIKFLDALKPQGEIVRPETERFGLFDVIPLFPDDPEERGRDCLSSLWHFMRIYDTNESGGEIVANPYTMYGLEGIKDTDPREYYGLVNAVRAFRQTKGGSQ